MLSLTEKSDNKVDINGKTYAIDTSFDNIICFRELLDEDIPNSLKVETGLKILLKEDLPIAMSEKNYVLNELMQKYIFDDAKEESPLDLEGNPMPTSKKQEYFSFRYDADLIFSAFMQAYNIDLEEQQGKLEWKKFKALLAGLPGDTRFNEVVDIRKRPYPKGKGSGKERTELMRLKRELSYPGVDFSEIGGD